MTQDLRVLIAPRNATVGDLLGNLAIARDVLARHAADTDLIVFPEAFLVGYQADDLVLQPGFLRDARASLDALAESVRAAAGPAVLVGTILDGGTKPHNAAVLLYPDGTRRVATKVDLPDNGPFDERRTFAPGALREPFPLAGVRVGVAICEEAWHGPVIARLAAESADLVVVLNASPYTRDKHADQRLPLMRRRIRETGLPLVYVNLVGGQDELVYDGASFALAADGAVVTTLPAFAEAEAALSFERRTGRITAAARPGSEYPDRDAADYAASQLALRDYVEKNRFPGIVYGNSGGLDSAFTGALAVDALGRDRVLAVTMPSHITTGASLGDALHVADGLGIRQLEFGIGDLTAGIIDRVAPEFGGRLAPLTRENIQPRLRMTLLMAVSNEAGLLTLATSNKSEASVGYTTIYGDMAGGFNPIKDLWKTEVARLATLRNGSELAERLGLDLGERVPPGVIAKPPSAELSEGQTDEAALGPYDLLDPALRLLVEEQADVAETARILQRTHAPQLRQNGRADDLRYLGPDHLARIARLVRRAEHKRRQAPIGPKLSARAFGRDRRFPITNHYDR